MPYFDAVETYVMWLFLDDEERTNFRCVGPLHQGNERFQSVR